MANETEAAGRITLHIGDVQSVISVKTTSMGMGRLVLSLGTIKTGREYFKHEPPTALEIEHAIENIEDELFRIRDSVPSGSELYTADDSIRRIATIAGINDQTEAVLGLDLVEKTFDRLAALAMGRPITQDSLPTNPEFAATLVILRELMHHLRFSQIIVTSEK